MVAFWLENHMIADTIENWHQLIKAGNPDLLNDLLADDVVFHSPVMYTPQEGKPLVKMYLTAAFHVLLPNDFKYLRQVIDKDHAMLEFQADIDGIVINGIDMITINEAGKIVDFKVMLRPLKALNVVQAKMFELLEQSKQ
jgi:hypothetical protein